MKIIKKIGGKKIVLSLILILLLINNAKAASTTTYIVNYAGSVTWSDRGTSRGASGVLVKAFCYSYEDGSYVQVTGEATTDSNGNYDIPDFTIVRPSYNNNPRCTIKMSSSNYQYVRGGNTYSEYNSATWDENPLWSNTNFNKVLTRISETKSFSVSPSSAVSIDYESIPDQTCSTSTSGSCTIYKGESHRLKAEATGYETKYLPADYTTTIQSSYAFGTLDTKTWIYSFNAYTNMPADTEITNSDTDATVSTSGDGGGQTCSYSNSQWECPVLENNDFTLSITKTGFGDFSEAITGIAADTDRSTDITLSRNTIEDIPVTVDDGSGSGLAGSTLTITDGISCDDEGTNDGVWACDVYSNYEFSLTADHTDFDEVTQDFTRTDTTAITIDISRTELDYELTATAGGTTIDGTTFGSVSVGGAGAVSETVCGYSTGIWTCDVYKNLGFDIRITADGYLTYTNTGVTISESTTTPVVAPDLDATLLVTIAGDAPDTGLINANTYTANVNGNGNYEMPLPDATYTLSYTDSTNKYYTESITSAQVTTSTEGTQQTSTITVKEYVDITIPTNVNSNADFNDGSGWADCSGDGSTSHVCGGMLENTAFDLSVSATGYVTYTNSYPGYTEDQTFSQIDLSETLRVEITGSPTTGKVTVDSQEQTVTGDGYYYFALADGDYTAAYSDETNTYMPASVPANGVSSASQTQVVLNILEYVDITVPTNVNSKVEINENSQGWVECSGTGSTSHVCSTISNGVAFDLRVTASGYVTETESHPGYTTDTTVSQIDLSETLIVEVIGDNPTTGTLDVGGIQKSVTGNGFYYFALADGDYTVEYTGNGDFADNSSPVNGINNASPTTIQMFIAQLHTANVLTEVNSNVDFSYDQAEWNDCTGDGTTDHDCKTERNRPFWVRATSDGYLTIEQSYPGPTGDQMIAYTQDETLRVEITGDNPTIGKITAGTTELTVDSGNGYYYLAVSPGTHDVTYSDNTNRYSEKTEPNQNINTLTQTQVVLDITETIQVTIPTRENAYVKYSYDDSFWYDCTGDDTTSHVCYIESGQPFYIKTDATGYVTQKYFDADGETTDTSHSEVQLEETLVVEILGDDPTGTLSVAGEDSISVTGNGFYNLSVSNGNFNVEFFDPTFTFGQNTSPVSISNASPTEIQMYIREVFDVTVNTDENAYVDLSYDQNQWYDCSGDDTTNHLCHAENGRAYWVRATATKYVTDENNYPGPTDDSTVINIDLEETFVVEIIGDNPTTGTLSVAGEDSVSVSGNGNYNLAVTPGSYTVEYNDPSQQFTDNSSPITVSNSAQTIIQLGVMELFDITVPTDVNSNVDFSYDQAEWNDCTGDGTTSHLCLVENSIPYWVRATSDGYINVEQSETGPTSDDTLTEIDMQETLRVEITGDNPTKGTISASDMNQGATGNGYYYFPLSPQTGVTASYEDLTGEFLPASNGPFDLNDQTQTQVVLNIDKLMEITAPTNVNANVDFNDGSGWNECSGDDTTSHVCYIARDTPFDLWFKSDGYIDQIVSYGGQSSDITLSQVDMVESVSVMISANPGEGTLSVGSLQQTVDNNSPYSFAATNGLHDVVYTSNDNCDARTTVLASNSSPETINFWSANFTLRDVDSILVTDADFRIDYETYEFNCPYFSATQEYNCIVPEGTDYTIKVTHQHYQDNNTPFTAQSSDYNDVIILEPEAHEVTINTNVEATVEYTYDDTVYNPCSGTNPYTCSVYAGRAFNVSLTRLGYVDTYHMEESGIDAPLGLNIDLPTTVRINTGSTEPVRGDLTATSNVSPIYDQTFNMVGDSSIFLLPLDPDGTDYTISYDDATGRYTSTGNISPANASPLSQSIYDLTINELVYDLDIRVRDENNDYNLIGDANVIATFDGSDHNCPYVTSEYICQIPHNTFYNVRVERDGYVQKYLHESDSLLISAPAPGTSIDVKRTLKIFLEDDGGYPIESGDIYINNSDNTQVLFHTILNNNNEYELYYYLSPGQEFNVYYFGGSSYEDRQSEGNSIDNPPTIQETVNLGSVRTWNTQISVTSAEGAVGGYDIIIDGDNHDAITSYPFDRTAHTVKAIKEGYTSQTININDPNPNDGAALNFEINKTLMVNVTKEEDSEPVSGTVKIFLFDTKIAEVTLSNGVGWLPIKESDNINPLTLEYESTGYQDIEQTIPAGTINEVQTHYIDLETNETEYVKATVKDEYTGEEFIDAEVEYSKGYTTYCRGYDCDFDMEDAPETVDIKVERDGYITKEISHRVSEDKVTIKIKPRMIVTTNIEVNVSVVDTRYSESTIDDDEILFVNSTSDGYTSIAIDDYMKVMLNITADGYQTQYLGPYITETDETTVVGPITMLEFNSSINNPPIVSSASFEPTNPSATDSITITAEAHDHGGGFDRIEACELKINNNYDWLTMNADYNDYEVVATKNIGILGEGNHDIYISCYDEDGISDDYKLDINIGSSEPSEPTDPTDPDEPDTPDEPEEPAPESLRLSELRNKYELLVKSGQVTEEIVEAMSEAEESIGSNSASKALDDLEDELPLITLSGEGTVKTIKISEPEDIAKMIAEKEDQPYTSNELKDNMEKVVFKKTAKRFTLDGEEKTMITLSVFSRQDNPDAIIADFNPGDSNAVKTITTSEGSISYFKGLSAGDNVFEYVINGHVDETSEPIIFTMKTLTGAEKTIKEVGNTEILGIPVSQIPVVNMVAYVIGWFISLF